MLSIVPWVDPLPHAGDRLGHRLRKQPVAIAPAILIVLAQNLIVLGDQEAGDRIA
jgi:hypothetical protein